MRRASLRWWSARGSSPAARGSGASSRPTESAYTAFISYNRAVDGRLAPALQRALHGFAKPWYRLRALRVFRDDASLAANSGLWSSIERALADSKFFILLASPEAAHSKWVTRETSYWVQHKPSANLLIVLTDGKVVWDEGTGDFDWQQTTALPQSLQGVFTEEPRYIDLRWARSEDHVSLHSPSFRECVADLAAPLHGQAKDRLVGEDVRQHRRTLRLARSAVVVLAVLALLASSLAVLAESRGNLARKRLNLATSRYLAGQAVADLDDRLDRSLLLSLEALRTQNTVEARGALLAGLERSPRLFAFLHNSAGAKTNDEDHSVAFSPDGKTLAAGSQNNTVRLWDVASHRRLGELPTGVAPL